MPRLSSDPTDKTCAAMNQSFTPAADAAAPDYFDACARWWDTLTPAQRMVALELVSFGDRDGAVAELAPMLPSAPTFPAALVESWPSPLTTFTFPRGPKARREDH